jgi:hypothetical protein
LRHRVDTPVGPWFSKTGFSLEQSLFQELLTPLVLDQADYEFDTARFDIHYDRWEQALLIDEVSIVDFLPLSGFEAGIQSLELPVGFTVMPMTQAQINAALHAGAVTIKDAINFAAITIARQDQWCLARTQTHPLEFGYDNPHDSARLPPSFEDIMTAGATLVRALRIVSGGSVTITRPLRGQREQDFPILSGWSSLRSTVLAVDLERPCIVTTDQVSDLLEIFGLLQSHSVRADQALAIALRRLVFAGTRSEAADRLIDLLISAEILFLKRSNTTTVAKGQPVAEAAVRLLREDPSLKTELGSKADIAARVHELMRSAYRRRNAEMHGDVDLSQSRITGLSGRPLDDLATGVRDLDRLVRLAFHRTLQSMAEPTA